MADTNSRPGSGGSAGSSLAEGTGSGPVVFIGGLGGSGTRAVADAIARLGFYPGDCLNESNDNLIFTTLLKQPDWLRRNPPVAAIHARLALFEELMTTGIQERHVEREPGLRLLQDRQRSGLAGSSGHLGWMTKEPNCHIFLEPILRHWRSARFVYVSRHPFDMAFSNNKGQLQNWSWLFDLDPTAWPSPEAAQLEYWIRTQRRLDALIARHPGRIFALRFEDFVDEPAAVLNRMIESWNLPVPSARVAAACADIIRPPGIGRWRDRDLSTFSEEQVAFCRDTGWDVNVGARCGDPT